MRRIFFALALFILPALLFSQNNLENKNNRFEFNLGPEYHFPLKPFSTFYKYGLGISGNVEYKISKHFSVSFNPGYVAYYYNIRSVGLKGNTPYMTLLGGMKYYFPYKIFVDAQAGFGEKLLQGQKESAFTFSGGAGIYFLKKFTAEIKYLKIKAITSTPENIVLRLGYSFGD
ncbi:MAG: hypothetical protein M3004_06640 [Bacteroidota bacterium]|nr:hypothetical protein [Bacteroidota bacterium]